jgi:Ca2+-transporting ATPase
MAQSSTLPGLSSSEAAARLAADGPNELPRQGRRTTWRIIAEVLREPMLALLIGAGAIYLLIGDLAEALILLAFACMSVLITVVQEARTERVLEALRDLSSPRALVMRDGVAQRIAGRDVVRGDVVMLGEGDRVPADARLAECRELTCDESLLTGESVPVRKAVVDGSAAPVPGGDGQPFVYSGALVVRGTGIAEVTATGPRSEIGKIGQSLRAIDMEPPRLQSQTRRMVRIFAVMGISVSAALVLLHGLLHGNWLEGTLAGIAVGMSLLPEEFPVVLTVFMAMGAWRMSRSRVLTRRAAAIEALGSATALCTDKTGTLTENQMGIAEMWLPNGKHASADGGISGAFAALVYTGARAAASQAFDPMDRAFLVHHVPQEELSLERVYGLRPELLAVTQAWREHGSKAFTVATKGAPEAIARLCKLPAAKAARMADAVNAMAAKGLRVLGVASASHSGKLPKDPSGFRFRFEGLVGLADPLRASVPEAIRLCRSAGIRVIMITGDYPATARAIADQAGIAAGAVLCGDDIAALDDGALRKAVAITPVFARVLPQQKLRIVSAMKANGEVVAMTGDGVNDAPSLKAAHIGIAMGKRGTDVAREASAIVLLDDDFGSIVKAVSLGRRIYDNLRKAMGFILAVHIPIAGLALAPLLLGMPVLFTPIHIAFLEMVIDPVCSLAFEAEGEERDSMKRPPRDPQEALFNGPMLAWSVIQGGLTLAMVAAIYMLAQLRGMPDDEVRALTFITLVLALISLIFVDRSFSASPIEIFTRGNRALSIVLAAVFAIMALSLLWPPAAALFRFGPLHGDDLLASAAAAGALLIVLDVMKFLWFRMFRPARG